MRRAQIGDYLSAEGAVVLSDCIAAYWVKRGASVEVVVEPSQFEQSARSAFFCVRSNLINGLPREFP